MDKNPPSSTPTAVWDAVTKLFHWSTALLILVMIVLGWLAVSYPMSPTKIELFTWHKSLGLFILAWTAFRLAWRATRRAPPLPEGMSRVEQWSARVSHTGLYLLLIGMPVSGWIINSAADFPLKWFGLFRVPQLVSPDERLQHIAEDVHYVLFWLIAILVIIHAAAAFHHHFVRRTDVLRRMLPSRRNRP
jgi:cytochrome b561